MIISHKSSYLSAERCQQRAEKLETSAEEKKQNETVENYLNLMAESKALKIHIAKLTSRQPDVSQIEKYGKMRFSFLLYDTFSL
jgi:HPt (histidine-containing phosphotransfer) domain-containing protein